MLLSQLQDGALVPDEPETTAASNTDKRPVRASHIAHFPVGSAPPLQQKLLLLIQSLSSHEDLHLGVEGKRAVVLAEAVQQFGVLKRVPLVTN